MGILISLIINGLAFFITAELIPGVTVDSFFTSIIAGVVLSLINTFIKPILVILTIPATIITLGLFTLVINALMIFLVARFVPGFHVDGFWAALFFSLVLSLVSSVLRSLSNS